MESGADGLEEVAVLGFPKDMESGFDLEVSVGGIWEGGFEEVIVMVVAHEVGGLVGSEVERTKLPMSS